MFKYIFFISLILSLLVTPQLAQAQTLLCKVVNVSDGDTINCLDKDKTQHRVRLSEIDAPERKQAFGQKARNYLRDLVIHKNVQIRVDGRDRYKRVLGTVYLNQRNINLEMVQSGYAWAYVRYLKDPAYTKAEAQARRLKRGIWAEGNAIYPEDFRRRNRR
ncbi:MAG: thermonuclease family protein [Pelistega sp.]|nr:thermonuclease family protein [Pelistega sp.]